MRLKTSAWFIVLCALSGCQVFSGISPLYIDNDAGISDRDNAQMEMHSPMAGKSAGGGGKAGQDGEAGQAGNAGAGGNAGSAGDPAMAGSGGSHDDCMRDKDAECNWLDDCGCKDSAQHCQARGAEAKATCVKKGKRKLGETCKSPDDCEQGTCDQKVCREYCEGDRCDGGLCLPHTGEGDKPVADVKVCWKSCQVQKQEGCVSGTSCQTREVHGVKGAFCIPPADPCPTKEDGICDEPVTCAPGTDSVDCSCQKPEGAACNAVNQCGCPKDQHCQFINNKLACGARTGTLPANALCETSAECSPGYDCIGYPTSSCKKYCDTNNDCPGKLDQCKSVVDPQGNDIPGYKICVAGCDETTSCPEQHACIKRSTGSSCLAFEPDVPGSTCNLTRQIGCENMSGTACVADLAMGKAVCEARSGMVPSGGLCETREQCEPGSDCFMGVCRSYCDPSVGLNDPSTDPTYGCRSKDDKCGSPQRADGTPTPFHLCLQTCAANRACPSGLACANSSDFGPICIKPLTTDCPTDNKKCDEPQGTGLCAAGFDTAECMGAP